MTVQYIAGEPTFTAGKDFMFTWGPTQVAVKVRLLNVPDIGTVLDVMAWQFNVSANKWELKTMLAGDAMGKLTTMGLTAFLADIKAKFNAWLKSAFGTGAPAPTPTPTPSPTDTLEVQLDKAILGWVVDTSAGYPQVK